MKTHLKIRFTGEAAELMADAIEVAKELGEITQTRFKLHNDDLYLDIPPHEVLMWLEVFHILADEAGDDELRLDLIERVELDYDLLAHETPSHILEHHRSSVKAWGSEGSEVGDGMGSTAGSKGGAARESSFGD